MRMKFNLTGVTRNGSTNVDGRSRKQKWVEINPTVLQRNLAHYRNHPNCKDARATLRLYTDEEIALMTAQIPSTWWMLEKDYLKTQGDENNE